MTAELDAVVDMLGGHCKLKVFGAESIECETHGLIFNIGEDVEHLNIFVCEDLMIHIQEPGDVR
jgi:hypothetical protein